MTASSRAKTEYPWLDWLRFSAAILVVAGHLKSHLFVPWDGLDESGKTPTVAVFYAVSRLGTEAVAVFFVLSGFLVGGHLIERVRNGNLVPS